MANLLLSGPAGAGKTQAARDIIRDAATPTVALDFQTLYAAVLLLDKVDGRYPERNAADSYALSMAEYLRRAGIRGATNHQLDMVVTNSDGDPERRAALLTRMGPGSTERVIDPGVDVVRNRLSIHTGGILAYQCEQAIDRWYGRLIR